MIQQIFQAHPDYPERHKLTAEQKKAFRNISYCRTGKYGFRISKCDNCGHEIPIPNSCRNRNCPICQNVERAKWRWAQGLKLLPVQFYHAIFTLPHELNDYFLNNEPEMIDMLFQAANEALSTMCKDKKHLGATPGAIAALHTWGQNLSLHPHVHMAVTGGGISDLGKWVPSKEKSLVPVKPLSIVYRGIFLKKFKKKFPDADQQLLDNLYNKNWEVYCKPPFKNTSQVMDYIARYVNRVAITDKRIVSFIDDKVTFKYRDYADGNKEKTMTLDAEEFIRRFLMHVVPHKTRKLRFYGIYAPRNLATKLVLAFKLLRAKKPSKPCSTREIIQRLCGAKYDVCPICGRGRLCPDVPLAEPKLPKLYFLRLAACS